MLMSDLIHRSDCKATHMLWLIWDITHRSEPFSPFIDVKTLDNDTESDDFRKQFQKWILLKTLSFKSMNGWKPRLRFWKYWQKIVIYCHCHRRFEVDVGWKRIKKAVCGVWRNETRKQRTLVWAKIFCSVFAETKKNSFKNPLVYVVVAFIKMQTGFNLKVFCRYTSHFSSLTERKDNLRHQ